MQGSSFRYSCPLPYPNNTWLIEGLCALLPAAHISLHTVYAIWGTRKFAGPHDKHQSSESSVQVMHGLSNMALWVRVSLGDDTTDQQGKHYFAHFQIRSCH